MGERAGRCFYCGEARLRTDDPLEHILPLALGGGLTTTRVCVACNSWVGTNVDQPFAQDFFIRVERAVRGVPDRRGGRVTPPSIPVKLEGGHTGELRIDGGLVVHARPVPDGDRISIIAANDEQLNEVVEKLEKRLARDGLAIQSRTISRRTGSQKGVGTLSFNPTTWLRMCVKLALGAASLALPDSWLDSANATQLRTWLRGSAKEFGPAAPMVVPEELAIFCPHPPDHTMFFIPNGAGRAMFAPIFFGRIFAGTVQLEFDPTVGVLSDGWRLSPQPPNRLVKFSHDEQSLYALMRWHASQGLPAPEGVADSPGVRLLGDSVG